MVLRPPNSTLSDPLVPYTTLFRSQRRAQQLQRRTIAGALDPDRTAAAVAIAERCGKQTCLWITQRVREIICHAAAWCEAIGIITKALGVDTLEFSCEVRQPAVVFGIEAVRLAASGVADQNHIDIDATQSVDDRLARRTGDRKSTRLNSSHYCASRMTPSA